MKALHSFLGTNAPGGFVSLFQRAYTANWQVWLLKGGPGCGKSTLMKKLAKRLGNTAELVHCPSDPDSLDAVIISEKRVMVMDATAPHALEPMYPGCTEHLVNLDSGLDTARLYTRKKEIVKLFDENRACHRQVSLLLSAAAQVRLAHEEEARLWLRENAVDHLVRRALRELPGTEQSGSETRRFLRTVTPLGIVCWPNIPEDARGCSLQDRGGAAAHRFIEHLRKELLCRGQHLYTGMNCLFPQHPETLLLPEHKWVCLPDTFPTNGRLQSLELNNCYRPFTRILRDGCTDEERLLAEAELWQRRALSLHDKLETLYQEAMDFSVADEVVNTIGIEIEAIP